MPVLPDGLLQLLQDIGRAYLSLCQYDCSKAIQLFNDLPMHQHNTGWVRCQIGKAYFEMSEYQKVSHSQCLCGPSSGSGSSSSSTGVVVVVVIIVVVVAAVARPGVEQ